MAVALRRLAAAFGYSPHLQCVQSLFPLRFGNSYSSSVSMGDAPTVHPEFQQWHNGGGSFHTFACMDPTVFIEFGAVIGHNVVVAKNCILCGQVGIAGSVTIGDYVTMGGRVAVRDHLRLAATSYVTKDITGPGDYGGFPAVHLHEW
ncbi:UDP-3-O-acylglucosamine N-acyltransferase 2 [Pyrus ussuriensis x Pyrus communis]|uniref:UDP-3-O-acylglucosamine N-acyltransferase 2 n=1 Tax=Pyrus ussuriensis x Pyrus communis TaxID=2448454 RepID=A0A5N5FD69_9ROSA|nr:UDP-3-O-acylglucosamine N-acyltransferase 2 [Pyrus ussuriensis x Pyrus communis]